MIVQEQIMYSLELASLELGLPKAKRQKLAESALQKMTSSPEAGEGHDSSCHLVVTWLSNLNVNISSHLRWRSCSSPALLLTLLEEAVFWRGLRYKERLVGT